MRRDAMGRLRLCLREASYLSREIEELSRSLHNAPATSGAKLAARRLAGDADQLADRLHEIADDGAEHFHRSSVA